MTGNLITPHVGTRKKVRITRCTPSERLLNGYILDASDSLVLLHVFDDFEPDGYTIVRTQDITKVRSGPYERWWDHMLGTEGLLDGLDFAHSVDLSSMAAAIASVNQHFDHLIIECESLKEDDEDFYIGTLVRISDDTLILRNFDALGYWDSEPDEIDLTEITRVQFDAPYIRIFSKYTREGTAPEIPDDD